jgi:hypothetical protein
MWFCTDVIDGVCQSWIQLSTTPEDVTYVYAWGVAAVLGLWAIGYTVGAAVRVIRAA